MTPWRREMLLVEEPEGGVSSAVSPTAAAASVKLRGCGGTAPGGTNDPNPPVEAHCSLSSLSNPSAGGRSSRSAW